MAHVYSNKKRYDRHSMALYLSTQLCCGQKNKIKIFHTKTGNHLNLISIPKESSNLMPKQFFFHFCKSVNCHIVEFVTLNDGQECQIMKMHH